MIKRVILISGATGGLGHLVAHSFAADGHSLVLLGTNKNKLDGLLDSMGSASQQAFPLVLNLKDDAATREAAEKILHKFGVVHILIHLVGGWIGGRTLVDADLEDLEDMFAQHGRTSFNLIHYFVPEMIRTGWGRVLAVSSPSAVHPPGKNGAYAAGKAVLESLLLTTAAEFGDQGVTSNILQVKSIDIEHKGEGTSPESIISAMKFLCTEEAGKINGARIPLY